MRIQRKLETAGPVNDPGGHRHTPGRRAASSLRGPCLSQHRLRNPAGAFSAMEVRHLHWASGDQETMLWSGQDSVGMEHKASSAPLKKKRVSAENLDLLPTSWLTLLFLTCFVYKEWQQRVP